MRRITLGAGLLALMWIAAASPEPAAEEPLGVGQPAPDFRLQGSDGETHRLADLLARGGSRGIVLAFFPRAFTPG